MRRDPTIHVRRSALVRCLRNIDATAFPSTEALVDQIFFELRGENITNRFLVSSKSTTEKRYKTASEIDKSKVNEFHSLLVNIRLSLCHKGVKTKLSPNTSAYTQTAQAALLAYQYAEDYRPDNLTKGLQEFIRDGLRLMDNAFFMNKFQALSERLFFIADCRKTIETNPNQKLTKQLYDYWVTSVFNLCGETVDVTQSVDKFFHFVLAAAQALEVNAEAVDWVDAQFHGLAGFTSYPDPAQLHGENAQLRFVKYKAEVLKEKKESESGETDLLAWFNSMKE